MASLAPKQPNFHFQLLVVAAIVNAIIQHWNFNGTSGLNDQRSSEN